MKNKLSSELVIPATSNAAARQALRTVCQRIFRSSSLLVLVAAIGFSPTLYAQHCVDAQSIVLFRVSGNENPADISALPELAKLVAMSDGGWQSQAHSLADVAAQVNQVGQYAPTPVAIPQPTAIASASRPAPVSVAITSTSTPTAATRPVSTTAGTVSVSNGAVVRPTTRPVSTTSVRPVATVAPTTPARPTTQATPATSATPATPAVTTPVSAGTGSAPTAHSGAKVE